MTLFELNGSNWLFENLLIQDDFKKLFLIVWEDEQIFTTDIQLFKRKFDRTYKIFFERYNLLLNNVKNEYDIYSNMASKDTISNTIYDMPSSNPQKSAVTAKNNSTSESSGIRMSTKIDLEVNYIEKKQSILLMFVNEFGRLFKGVKIIL